MARLWGLRNVRSKQLTTPLRPWSIATATAATTTTQTSLAVTVPSSRISGDLLIIFGCAGSTARTLTPPAGWDTRLTSTGRLIATRTSDGTEGSTTITADSATNIKLVAAVIRRGLYDNVGTLSTAGSSTTAASITLGDNKCIVFGFFSSTTANVSISTNASENIYLYANNITTAAASIRIWVRGYKINAGITDGSIRLNASGASGTMASSISSGTLQGVILSVKPDYTR